MLLGQKLQDSAAIQGYLEFLKFI